MKMFVLAAPLTLVSCVTSGDLSRLEDAHSAYQRDMGESLAELRAGAISETEFEAKSREESSELKLALAQVVEDVDQRTEAALTAASKGAPVTGNPLIDLGITAVAGFLGTTLYRDRKRKLRGEPVSEPKGTA